MRNPLASAALTSLLFVGGCAVFPEYRPAQKYPDRAAIRPASPLDTAARLVHLLNRHPFREHFIHVREDNSLVPCKYRDIGEVRVFEEPGATVSRIVLELRCDAAAGKPARIVWVNDQATRRAFGTSHFFLQHNNATQAATFLYQLAQVPPEAPAEFEAHAKAYREADPKPELPETARAYKVRAEAAVNEKNFNLAIENFDRALQIAPWWPQGHFNVALVLADAKAYGLAISEMQRYLALVPEAANARKAQDKIHEWTGKLQRNPL